MNQAILQFSYLQVLDFLTTVAFLLVGIKEANPVVKMAMALSSSPMLGLFLVKALAIVLGVYCWRVGKRSLLTRINIAFALLVAWNMVALIAGTAQIAHA